MPTSALLAATLLAALARAGPAADGVPELLAADDATCADCDGQAVGLLQSATSAARARRDAEGPAKAMLQYRFGSKRTRDTFDCDAYPLLCTEPFNCSNMDEEDMLRAWVRGAADGEPNFQTWCACPQYGPYISQCITDKDLGRAAQTFLHDTKSGVHGDWAYDLDASYCFIEGHCLNTAVTNDTTVEEASHMCDQRYGDRWRSIGNWDDPTLEAQRGNLTLFFEAYDETVAPGFLGHEHTEAYVMFACMMGNYHCDVAYCRSTHCQNQEMIDKYGHFLVELGWETNTEPWHVGAE